jgi:phage N-6-adenine-methyltransferase
MVSANGKTNAKAPHLTLGTADDEWYTPAVYIEAARTAMGGIDLDPASNALAQRWIRAGAYYTKNDDGLTKPWPGRVWLNPPYSRALIGPFIDKLVEEVATRRTTKAILLTHSNTDTAWYQAAATAASAVCYTRGRIRLEKDDGARAAPVKGSSFMYFGADVESFREAFRRFGSILLIHRFHRRMAGRL